MKRYVCGFLFTNSERYVVLIRKNKPAWQDGYWNGVGGKIEENETPAEAMAREFEEETGVLFQGWREFATLQQTVREDPKEHWLVHFFMGRWPGDLDMAHIRTCTSELVHWHEVATLQQLIKMVPNLKWLIPLSLEPVRGMLLQLEWDQPE